RARELRVPPAGHLLANRRGGGLLQGPKGMGGDEAEGVQSSGRLMSARTSPARVRGSNGLIRTPAAPSARMRSTSTCTALAVKKMTGVVAVAGCALSAARVSDP